MKNIEYFKNYYTEEKENINKALLEFNLNLKDDNTIFNDNLYLFKELNSDGKLIRGTLVNLGYNLLKEDKNYSNNLALAYEVFQTAILVHDDIIDKDKKRRGKTTIHQANIEKYQDLTNKKEELVDLSNSVALCIGDYGLFLANKIIADSYQNDTNLGKVLSSFNQTVLRTIKGEVLDVVLPFESKYKNIENTKLEETIMNIYLLKTAYYTIIGPLTAGLILAGADESKLKDIEKFGEKVGIAFQIQDDILGIYSNETGKSAISDIKEFKQTILYSYIHESEYKDEFKKYYGKEAPTEETIDKIKDLLDISGAKNYANSVMNKMYDESLAILDGINWINSEKKNILKGFVEYLKIRIK